MQALITGAGSGIGKAIALALSSAGYQVASASRNAEIIPAISSELRNAHPAKAEAIIKHADISDEVSCSEFIDSLPEAFHPPQVLVLNAGKYFTGMPSEMGITELSEALEANVLHAIQICQNIVPKMAANKTGTIVFTGSIVNHELRASACAYTLAKNVLNNYAKMLQDEFRNTGLRICRIQPGSVNTPSFDGENVPRELFVQPEQIAEAVKWIVNLPATVQVEELIIRPSDKNW